MEKRATPAATHQPWAHGAMIHGEEKAHGEPPTVVGPFGERGDGGEEGLRGISAASSFPVPGHGHAREAIPCHGRGRRSLGRHVGVWGRCC